MSSPRRIDTVPVFRNCGLAATTPAWLMQIHVRRCQHRPVGTDQSEQTGLKETEHSDSGAAAIENTEIYRVSFK